MKFKIFSILILITLIAGCTFPGQTATVATINKGVVINSFDFNPSQLEGEFEEGVLNMEIQNLGGTDARQVIAYLYGMDFDNTWTITNDNGDNYANYSFGDLPAPDQNGK